MEGKVNVTVVGLGYVGMSLAVLLSRQHNVVALDVNPAHVKQVNAGNPTVNDALMSQVMVENSLSLRATTNAQEAYEIADFIIVATPTNYDPEKNYFDTRSVETVVSEARMRNPRAAIVIKSTVPVGFTSQLRAKLQDNEILFSPEFLREGQALYDNLHPSRIIVGGGGINAPRFASLLEKASLVAEVPTLLMDSMEAEAVKLFANTYLAMRVAFFNELDSFGLARGLNVKQIIEGVSLDTRIGQGYNNPSFGYGGYCLPKDTKQLLANYEDIPQHIMQGIVDANVARKDFIAEEILSLKPRLVGIYRLAMKSGSDNMRSSAMQGVMKRLKAKGVEIVVFEPLLTEDRHFGSEVVGDLKKFLDRCDLILCNRVEPELLPAKHKLFTRDVYGEN